MVSNVEALLHCLLLSAREVLSFHGRARKAHSRVSRTNGSPCGIDAALNALLCASGQTALHLLNGARCQRAAKVGVFVGNVCDLTLIGKGLIAVVNLRSYCRGRNSITSEKVADIETALAASVACHARCSRNGFLDHAGGARNC